MKNYTISLIERPLDAGLTIKEINEAAMRLRDKEVIPIEIQAEFSTAMGFIGIKDASDMGYDYTKIEDYVRSIMEDMKKENRTGDYHVNVNGKTYLIWLRR